MTLSDGQLLALRNLSRKKAGAEVGWIAIAEARDLTEAQVREHVRTNLAHYKTPKIVVFDNDLPREDTGKLMKRKIRARYWPPTQ